ncbi:MAG: DNA polymerase III subunit beta [Candidatus Magasanikbacteria bacterium RIFOXYD2_FULL_41_14]|uniref:Beta sliding clamp n=1 Tax=Candidatus Magasanikbacteria bacterium RIFOXYD2_FULL_41_14 TaxID=1798709 RepID=A0A1F6PBQ0_9BACT|nr:MAG: DNA polymerase III subunit beta [Candidatus Magasanikbacteria bacterium RIFOXYD2_FULL_41_14]
MKLSCTKDNLSQALALIGGIANKSVNLPILGNVLIKADSQVAEIVATNLELAVVSKLRAKIDEPGSFTVPARTLADFVNLLAGEKVDIELVDNELVVTCGKAVTKIKGSPADDFPVVPVVQDGQGYVLPAEDLKIGLNQVIPALARHDIRPELAGVYFAFNTEYYKGLVLAATDSYRLAEKKLALSQGIEEFKTIVPGRTAQEIHHILSSVVGDEKNIRLLINENQLAINYNDVQLVSRLVEGKYPDYTQIIPKNFTTTVTFSTAQLIKEIKSASLFSTTGVNGVAFKFNTSGVVSINSTSTQTGEYQSEISTDVSGQENNILLNHRYLLDGLGNMRSEAIVMKLTNADSPCLVQPDKDDSYLYIVMPIRQ